LESVLTLVASTRTAVKDRSPLRGAPLVPRSASLTASSLRPLSFHREAGAPRFLVSLDSDFMNFPWSWRSCGLKKIVLRGFVLSSLRSAYDEHSEG
jgi:hypothetical protein